MANYMIVRHGVKNFTDWKNGYDQHEPVRAAAGLTEKYLLQDAGNPTMVTLLFKAEDLKRAEDFAGSADLHKVMEKIGVGQPEIYFLKN